MEKRGGAFLKFTDFEISETIRLHKEGKNASETARILGRSRVVVAKYLKKNNIKPLSREEFCRKRAKHNIKEYDYAIFKGEGFSTKKTKSGDIYYLFKCKFCGDVIQRIFSNVDNKTRCKKCKANPDYLKALNTTTYNIIIKNAKLRNIKFDVSIDYLSNLIINQNYRCALSGVCITLPKNVKERTNSMFTASLDRIDSGRGYFEDNVQWVHKHVNQMKFDFDQEYFLKLCSKIHLRSHHNERTN